MSNKFLSGLALTALLAAAPAFADEAKAQAGVAVDASASHKAAASEPKSEPATEVKAALSKV